MMKFMATLLACAALCVAGDDNALKAWTAENLWSTDSVSLPEPGTVEIHRDISDLYQASLAFKEPGVFGTLFQYHAFTMLSGRSTRKLFSSDQEVKRLRLVLGIRRSERDTLETIGKFRINRESIESSKFKFITQTQTSDPKRFLSLCQQKFDGVWIHEGYKTE